jgi:branched-chain amino acid transport system permease protein
MTTFLSYVISGLALGAQYSLIVLGFVVIYRASGVLNFAQGAMVLLGCYLAYTFHVDAHWPFALALIGAAVSVGTFSAAVQLVLLRTLVDKPPFAVIMATLGLTIVIDQVVISIWGPNNLNMSDPWGISAVHLLGVAVQVSDLWTIGLAGLCLVAFFAIFRFTRVGLAMRATASDREAALMQGISPAMMFAVAWGIAGAVAGVAGVTAGVGVAQVQPSVGDIAFVAIPAMVLGGLESPSGAVIGGLTIGVIQELTAGYQPSLIPFLGSGFESVMPYVVMVVVLLIRPTGLFGLRQARRA